MHPHFKYDSTAMAHDLDLDDTNAYCMPGNITGGVQHGSWTVPVEKPEDFPTHHISSSQVQTREELVYSEEDDLVIEDWVRRHVVSYGHYFLFNCF